jgi:flagellar motor switch protein FliM
MVVMEIVVGHSSGMMNICYPVITLESILNKLASRDFMLSETNAKKSRNQELRALMGGARVQVNAFLGDAELSLAELLNLKQGDIIRLDRPADDTAVVTADGKDRFIGKIGLRRFRKSVEIVELIVDEKDEVKEILESIEQERRAKLATTLVQEEEEE